MLIAEAEIGESMPDFIDYDDMADMVWDDPTHFVVLMEEDAIVDYVFVEIGTAFLH